MPVAPGAPLLDFPALDGHVPAGQVVPDDRGDGAVLDERGQDLDRKSEERGDAGHVRFRAGGLQGKRVATVNRLPIQRGDPDSHAGGND